MPKPNTFPTLFDRVLQLNLDKLKKDGYLIPGQARSGSVTWSCNGNKSGSIGFMVDMTSASPYIELNYSYSDNPRKYRVRLVSIPSNLGKGEVWFFLCPETSRRCRILYSVGGWFLHREAFRGVYYDSQTRSKKTRTFDRIYGPLFRTDKLYKELRKPYFKPYYNGLPTKRHVRINKKLYQASQISVEDWERAVVGIL